MWATCKYKRAETVFHSPLSVSGRLEHLSRKSFPVDLLSLTSGTGGVLPPELHFEFGSSSGDSRQLTSGISWVAVVTRYNRYKSNPRGG